MLTTTKGPADRSAALSVVAGTTLVMTLLGLVVLGRELASGEGNPRDLRPPGRFTVLMIGAAWSTLILAANQQKRTSDGAGAAYAIAVTVPTLSWVGYSAYVQHTAHMTSIAWTLLLLLPVTSVLALASREDVRLSYLFGDRHRVLSTGRMVAAVVVVAAVFCIVHRRMQTEAVLHGSELPALDLTSSDGERRYLQWYENQKRRQARRAGDGRVLVVEYSDYTCPICKSSFVATQQVLRGYEATWPGAFRYERRSYPLGAECNGAVPETRAAHRLACEAAVAVRLAERYGRAVQLQEWLLVQWTLTEEDLWRGARQVGGVTDADLDSRMAVLDDVRAEAAKAGADGVRGTPAFFVNGVLVHRAGSKEFDLIMRHELGLVKGEGRPGMHTLDGGGRT